MLGLMLSTPTAAAIGNSIYHGEQLQDPGFDNAAKWTAVGTGATISASQLNTGPNNGSGMYALSIMNAAVASYQIVVDVASFPGGSGTANLWVAVGYQGSDSAYVSQFVTATGLTTINFTPTNPALPIKVNLLSNGGFSSGAAVLNSASLKRL